MKVLKYCSLGVRWDGVEHYRWITEDGIEHECYSHASNHSSYYHFGNEQYLTNPPPYDQELERGQRNRGY